VARQPVFIGRCATAVAPNRQWKRQRIVYNDRNWDLRQRA
jgi:hypothetical protein